MKKALKLDKTNIGETEKTLEQTLKVESAFVQVDSMTVLKEFEQIDFANQLHWKLSIMELPIIRFGNSKGILLSNAILEKYNFNDRIEIRKIGQA